MIILRDKSFSKDDPKPKLKERNGNPELALAAVSLSSTPLGMTIGKEVSRASTVNKIKGEVMNRLDEINQRALKGDKKAIDAVRKLSDPEAMSQLVNKTFDNPRVRKAMKKGRIIGASIPLLAGGTLIAKGYNKDKKYKEAKKQYDKDIKAWRERNKK